MDKSYASSHLGREAAQNYEDKEYGDNAYSTYLWNIEKDYLLRVLKKLNSKKINYLDFACGTGRVINFVESYVYRSSGVDISEEMLNIARKKVKHSTLYKKDILKDKLTGTYDLITVFRFFLNAEPFLREKVLLNLKSCMKKDALLIFNIHGNTFSFRFITSLIFRIFLKRKLNQLSYYDIRKLMDTLGFKIVDCAGMGFLPKVMYRIGFLMDSLYKIDFLLYKLKLFRYFSRNLVFTVKQIQVAGC